MFWFNVSAYRITEFCGKDTAFIRYGQKRDFQVLHWKHLEVFGNKRKYKFIFGSSVDSLQLGNYKSGVMFFHDFLGFQTQIFHVFELFLMAISHVFSRFRLQRCNKKNDIRKNACHFFIKSLLFIFLLEKKTASLKDHLRMMSISSFV